MAIKPEIEEHAIASLSNLFLILDYVAQPPDDGSNRTVDTLALRLIETCKVDECDVAAALDDMRSSSEMVGAFIEALLNAAEEIINPELREEGEH